MATAIHQVDRMVTVILSTHHQKLSQENIDGLAAKFKSGSILLLLKLILPNKNA